MPTVFVIGKEWKLRGSVRAELREMGIEALGMETPAEAVASVAGGTLPAAVILDAAADDAANPALAALARQVPFLVVASRIEAAPLLESAAAVLYKPVRVADIVARVKQLLEGRAA